MRSSIKTLLLGLVFISLIFACNKFPAFTGTSASFSDTKYANARISTDIWENLPELIGVPDINLTGSDGRLRNTTDVPIRATINPLENFNSSLNNKSLAEALGNLTSNFSISANETFNPTNSINFTNNTNFTGSANLTNTFDLDRTVSLGEVSNSTGSLVSGMGSGSSGDGGSGNSDNDEGILPEVFFSSNVTEGYVPLTVQLTDHSQNAKEWNWDFGDGSFSQEQNTIHTYSEAETYTITLDASNLNGTDSQSATLTVLEPPAIIVPPVADFSSSITRGPVPFSVQFTDLSENATEWNWDFGDGAISTEQNPVHIYSATGKYTVMLTVTNQVGMDTETRTDYIKVEIASSVKLTSITLDGENSTGATTRSGALTTNPEDSLGQIGVSDENEILFNQPSYKGPLGEISIPLQLGINSFSLIADGVYPENENYGAVLFFDGVPTPPQIAVYSSNGGTGTFSVQPASTDITGSANGGLFLDKAPGSSTYIAPDGTKIEVVSFVVDSKNRLIDEVSGGDVAPNGVPDTTAKLILKVTPSSILPVAVFSASTTFGTAPLNVVFNDSSLGSPTLWNWDFGDGAISTERNPVHTYSGAGEYIATLAVSNVNDTNSTSVTIVVLQPVLPVANFSSNVTFGNAPLTVQFTDLSENAEKWKWDFGDGAISTEQSPVHTYSTVENYTVSLTAYNANGTDSKLEAITVLKQSKQSVLPVANFSSNVTSGNAPLTVYFTDLSENAEKWKWDFGDGAISTERNPVHTYSGAGEYIATLAVSNVNGTNSTSITIITLQPVLPVVANFSSNVTSGNAPLTVHFTDLSENAEKWNWDFGDGAISTEQSPVHTYSGAGEYTVTLAVSNVNGTNSTSVTIVVLQPVLPVANFSSNVTFGNAPLTVQFTDLSENAEKWKWDFGDGAISTEQSPVHTYSATGKYIVTFNAVNANGQNTKTGHISVNKKMTIL